MAALHYSICGDVGWASAFRVWQLYLSDITPTWLLKKNSQMKQFWNIYLANLSTVLIYIKQTKRKKKLNFKRVFLKLS